ncbi:PREDICTED: phospholipase A2-beta-like [Camelina sativa]|uniref:Phospholipase A2-beta-like n=1 Tax=Camelina sativa TaxID=90675 RepID=A0ABM0XSB8_CAMSA|nr:PREDICTED: phospholipase A2-beta-like [Camelina sativa]
MIRFAAAFFITVLVGVVRSKECTRTCTTQNCDTISIRYGKYCGFGHFGCPGEEPCDDLDACCMVHDHCVGSKGMTNISCHKKFQLCVNSLSNSIKQSKDEKVGFAKQCPYSVVIPTVNQGMDIGILFSQLCNDIYLLWSWRYHICVGTKAYLVKFFTNW